MFNYSKLYGKIVEVFGTQANFADKMNLSERSISLKLNNKVPFNQNEIKRAIDVLGINSVEIGQYFFTLKVQCC